MKRHTSGNEVISAFSAEDSDDEVDYVPPSLEEHVDALPAYKDRTRCLLLKVCNRGRASRGRVVRDPARDLTSRGAHAASFSQ